MARLTKTLELEGMLIYDIEKLPDERGYFAEIIRADWKELVNEEIVQANLSLSYPGMVRAWHRHTRGQVDFFVVLQGSMKILAYDDREGFKTKGRLVEVTASEERLQVVRLPGHFWHGTKTLGTKPSLTLYLHNRLYDYNNPDEERRAWNDPSIIDPRTGQAFDWLKVPFK